MKLRTLTLTLALIAGSTGAHAELIAVRVGRAETAANGTIENAVLLIEDGKIVEVGEDLMLDRGIPVIDRPDWVAMPGLINAYTRYGLSGSSGDDFQPQVTPRKEITPSSPAWDELLELGVTSLAVYPAGNRVAGQAMVIQPHGESVDDMVVLDGAYLKYQFLRDTKSKKVLEDAFDKVADYEEKVAKEREKYEKELEKSKKKKKKSSSKKDDDEKKDEKKDDEKDDEKKEDEEQSEELGPFVPPEISPEIEVFRKVRDGELQILFSIGSSADFLHLEDGIEKSLEDPEFLWNLRVRSTTSLDIFYVEDEIGEQGLFVLIEPSITLTPGTMRQRNIPRELVDAGAQLVFLPRGASLQDHEDWRRDVGVMIKAGLDREQALRAMTRHPAEFLGLGERLGSLEPGKDANMIFVNGDPFELGTEVQAVMLEGEFVFGEVTL